MRWQYRRVVGLLLDTLARIVASRMEERLYCGWKRDKKSPTYLDYVTRVTDDPIDAHRHQIRANLPECYYEQIGIYLQDYINERVSVANGNARRGVIVLLAPTGRYDNWIVTAYDQSAST